MTLQVIERFIYLSASLSHPPKRTDETTRERPLEHLCDTLEKVPSSEALWGLTDMQETEDRSPRASVTCLQRAKGGIKVRLKVSLQLSRWKRLNEQRLELKYSCALEVLFALAM